MFVELKVGQVWKDREGRKVTVAKKDHNENYPFFGSNGETYTAEGTVYAASASPDDLIELVQDENGWRPWKATAHSQCPVAGDTLVQVRLADGIVNSRIAANYAWDSYGYPNVVAYRVVEEPPKADEPARQEPPAIRLLQVAADHMRDRAAIYDKPDGERSMVKTIDAFNAVTGRDLREAEGWLLLQILKDVRLFQRPGYHADSAEDCVAYAALKAEAKMAEVVSE